MNVETTTVYRCAYCRRRFLTKASAAAHERYCQCQACAHHQPGIEDETEQCPPVCDREHWTGDRPACDFQRPDRNAPWHKDQPLRCPDRTKQHPPEQAPGADGYALAGAAAAYCAGREREREILRRLKPCERVDSKDETNYPEGSPCYHSRLVLPPDMDDAGPLPVDWYCPACLANEEHMPDLRRVRRGHGGRMRAMFRAWRASR